MYLIHSSYIYLHDSFISASFQLHSCYISPTFELHFSYMLAIFQIHISYVSDTFQLHISYISDTCQFYLSYIPADINSWWVRCYLHLRWYYISALIWRKLFDSVLQLQFFAILKDLVKPTVQWSLLMWCPIQQLDFCWFSVILGHFQFCVILRNLQRK